MFGVNTLQFTRIHLRYNTSCTDTNKLNQTAVIAESDIKKTFDGIYFGNILLYVFDAS